MKSAAVKTRPRDEFRVEITIRKAGVSVTYALTPLVPPTPNTPSLPGVFRRWRLRKVVDGKVSEKERPYILRQDVQGMPLSCDCVGYQTWARCKHSRCLNKLFGVTEDAGEKLKAGQQVPVGVTQDTSREIPNGKLEEGVA